VGAAEGTALSPLLCPGITLNCKGKNKAEADPPPVRFLACAENRKAGLRGWCIVEHAGEGMYFMENQLLYGQRNGRQVPGDILLHRLDFSGRLVILPWAQASLSLLPEDAEPRLFCVVYGTDRGEMVELVNLPIATTLWWSACRPNRAIPMPVTLKPGQLNR